MIGGFTSISVKVLLNCHLGGTEFRNRERAVGKGETIAGDRGTLERTMMGRMVGMKDTEWCLTTMTLADTSLNDIETKGVEIGIGIEPVGGRERDLQVGAIRGGIGAGAGAGIDREGR